VPSLWPGSDFAKVPLDVTIFDLGAIAGRIYHRRYPQPLGFGKTPSRFSDPSPGDEPGRFGVLYLGATLKVCFIEAILRHARNGAVGDYPIEWDDLGQPAFCRNHADPAASPCRFAWRRGRVHGRAE
jgi:hypothetical protein